MAMTMLRLTILKGGEGWIRWLDNGSEGEDRQAAGVKEPMEQEKQQRW